MGWAGRQVQEGGQCRATWSLTVAAFDPRRTAIWTNAGHGPIWMYGVGLAMSARCCSLTSSPRPAYCDAPLLRLLQSSMLAMMMLSALVTTPAGPCWASAGPATSSSPVPGSCGTAVLQPALVYSEHIVPGQRLCRGVVLRIAPGPALAGHSPTHAITVEGCSRVHVLVVAGSRCTCPSLAVPCPAPCCTPG